MHVDWKNSIALDIGSKSLKMLGIKEVQDDGRIVVENFLSSALPPETIVSSLPDKPIVNPNVILETLKEMIKEMSPKTRNLIITIPDPLVIINWISMPMQVEERVEETIMMKLGPLLPSEIENWFTAYQKVSEAEKNNVLTEAALKETILTIGELAQKAGLVPYVIDSCFFNVLNLFYDYLALSENKEKNIAIVTMGHDSTVVAILRGTELRVHRKLATGGVKFTKILMSQLSINFDEAERLKKEGTFFLAESLSEQNRIENYVIIRPVFGELIKDMYNSFDSYLAKWREFKIDEIILTGGGANFKNINIAIQHHLNIPIKLGHSLVKVTAEKGITASEVNEFSAAIEDLLRKQVKAW